MKTIYFLFALLFTGNSAITANLSPDPLPEARETAQPPVYYTGNDKPAASTASDTLRAIDSLHPQAAAMPAAPAEKAANDCTPPVSLTGRDEPAASGLFIAE
jgi:hypothetical protein